MQVFFLFDVLFFILKKNKSYVADHSISSNMQYTGKALMAVTLPLGGLGTGTIAFSGDGGLRQWQPLSNHLI